MAAEPRISIVMPVFNGAHYLGAAIESVLQQDFGDFELICVDDGSTDATPEIIAHYAVLDARIRNERNTANIGLPATLNRGFALARGEFHSWTSHDNLLRPDMLSTLVGLRDADRAVDVVYGGYSVIDADGMYLRYQSPKPVEQRWFGNPVGAAFLYRSGVTEALGGYDESLFGAEDYDFWLRAARQFRFRAVDRDLYLYRRHGESLTTQRSRKIKDMVAAVMERELALADDRKLTAAASLNLVLTDHGRFRWPLVMRAFASNPVAVLAKLPALAYHFVRFIRHRSGG